MNYKIIFLNAFFLLDLYCCFIRGQNLASHCDTLEGTKWTCKEISDCSYANILISRKDNISCSHENGTQKICCPESILPRFNLKKSPASVESIRKRSSKDIAWEKCLEYAKYRFINETIDSQIIGEPPIFHQIRDCVEIVPLIVGGTEAIEKEFPHMALIGFGNKISQITWLCGGSLISERYILSAAHCTNLGTKYEVNWASVGLLSKSETSENKLNQNLFRIVERLNHPNYKPPVENNDIALYKLENPVTLSPHIRPICLTSSNEITNDLDMKAMVTGWGRTDAAEDSSETLLKVTINLLDEDLCGNLYKFEVKFKQGFDPQSMICAGDVHDAKGACQGDSGGPLQIPIGPDYECLWSIIGITSIGSAFCGSNAPAVYTKVIDYLPWIQSTVWPS